VPQHIGLRCLHVVAGVNHQYEKTQVHKSFVVGVVVFRGKQKTECTSARETQFASSKIHVAPSILSGVPLASSVTRLTTNQGFNGVLARPGRVSVLSSNVRSCFP
jgi:hypothetical protein